MTGGFRRFFVDVDSTTTPQLVQRLRRDGLVTFSGAVDRPQLLALARRLGEVRAHAHGDPDGATLITPRRPLRGPSTAGFSSLPLTLHTDGSSVERPPTLAMVNCRTTATAGGAVRLADGAAVHRDLHRTSKSALAALSAPGGARFGAGGTYEGAIYSVVPGTERLHIRFRNDADVWFSPDTRRALPLFAAVLHARSYTLELGVGDGYILQNGRWLHGRTAFRGPRSMLRVLCEPLASLLPFGFSPQAEGAAPDALPGRRVL